MISVVIPTYNRATLLRASLESLAAQSLPREDYEVVVIDDGSADATAVLCQSLSFQMNLRYFRIEHSGISAAKNLGVFVAGGRIILFFDDDDIADENLLAEHLKTHARYPLENVAVLGHTTWAPTLHVTELMHYVTEIGCFLFLYPRLVDGQILDFTYFRGGRTSCKRSLLTKRGVFNQRFQSIIEDIELGYRLSKFGLKVIFNRHAQQSMNRAITFDEFCRRCEKQGRAHAAFARLYSGHAVVREYCGVSDAQERWAAMAPKLETTVQRVREIEEFLQSTKLASARRELVEDLWRLYRWTFEAFKAKGLVEALHPGH